MHVRMARKIQLSQFEPAEFEILITTDDLPRGENEDHRSWINRATVEGHKSILAWEISHNKINSIQAVDRIAQLRAFHKVTD